MKRRLTDQQHRRISKAKQSHIENTLSTSGEQYLGRVISHHGQLLAVEVDGRIYDCNARQNIGSIVVGDQITFSPTDAHTGIITARLARSTVLARPDVYKQQKEIAANIDQMVIVMATMPEPVPHHIDKYLVAASLQKITPILVLNKIDLPISKALSELCTLYEALGYCVVRTSIYQSLEALTTLLKDKTSIVVGQSGVGKSALINALFGTEMTEVGAISDPNQKGKHTTTCATLYHLREGGDIIDSPGIREFGLWDISEAEAASGFVEFKPFLNQCKFRNCQHREEPGCALLGALHTGKIHPKRMESFNRIREEIQSR
ncbi:MAG: ribosome small subunit-dependent GTPase A [Gammaproteobacteria bacterium]|nr:ribosome small subunit-dependent GTPase A [Gammaproteobacteria bacterium]